MLSQGELKRRIYKISFIFRASTKAMIISLSPSKNTK
jgi:hypothetical protein